MRVLLLITGVLFLSFGCNQDSAKSGRPTLYNSLAKIPDVIEDPPTTEVPEIERPNEQVFIESDNLCVCHEGKPDAFGNCQNFCAGNRTNAPTLFVTTKLGLEITNNKQLVDLYGWCLNPLESTGSRNPQCLLEAFDGFNNYLLPVTIASSNRFRADVSALEYDKTYLLKLVETTSGAASKTFQIRRAKEIEPTPNLGPLQITPVSKYTCVSRTGVDLGNGNHLFENAAKVHYYFPEHKAPPPLPPGDPYLFCHDILTYGETDNGLIPRLELSEQFFLLWNEQDIRFYDQDSNGKLDINDLIQKRLADEYKLSAQINIFSEMTLRTGPHVDTQSRIGFVMSPWVEQNSQRVFCPGQNEYNSDSPVFNILEEVLGVETEALYLAQREPLALVTPDGETIEGPPDFLLIREGLLTPKWFYLQNGIPTPPTETNRNSKTLMFFWPIADSGSPLVKQLGQVIYTVRGIDNLSGEAQIGLRQGVRAQDKRIACIPKK